MGGGLGGGGLMMGGGLGGGGLMGGGGVEPLSRAIFVKGVHPQTTHEELVAEACGTPDDPRLSSL